MTSIGSDFNDRLVDILLRIPSLQDQDNRNLLLRNLPGPANTISRSNAPFTDLSNMVNAVAAWGKLESGELALDRVIENAMVFVKGTELESKLRTLLIHLVPKATLQDDLTTRNHPESEMDHIEVGKITDSSGIAIGRGARATVINKVIIEHLEVPDSTHLTGPQRTGEQDIEETKTTSNE